MGIRFAIIPDNTQIPDGVYPFLPHEAYHADPALSASGIKAMHVSPRTYWDRFMNPARCGDNDTKAKTLGRAIHKMVLEGPHEFAKFYACEPHPDDYPGSLISASDLRDKCGYLGLKKTGTIEEMSIRLLDSDPGLMIFPVIKNGVLEQAAKHGKEILKRDDYQMCLNAREEVQANDAARGLLESGLSEVSVFWTTSEGVRMKARFDWLNQDGIVDLKSFSNTQEIPVDRAVVMAAANRIYGVQAYIYLAAATAAKELIQSGRIFGGDLNSFEVLHSFAERQDLPRFHFIFLETGDVNNVLVRGWPRESLIMEASEAKASRAMLAWKENMRRYGASMPWGQNEPARDFYDEEFPLWAVE
ncbi:MAG: PD-(D/E)XK nuclease-like domain-containing protein [Magnetococcales bacterium]|nr:PD-(D/E)XK nuclease-like domain-containing protein [Magnetococcales bacterium]